MTFSVYQNVSSSGWILHHEHIVLFHPDALVRAKFWTPGWYREPDLFQIESSGRRIVAWRTADDALYTCRITDGDLTAAEAAKALDSWTFPYAVRHGRFFLDGGQAVPCDDQLDDAFTREWGWVEMANGNYAVTVTGIASGIAPVHRGWQPGDLPHYVLQFLPAGDQYIAPAPQPPVILCQPDIDPDEGDDIWHRAVLRSQRRRESDEGKAG